MYQRYRRTNVAEMIPYTPDTNMYDVSISASDVANGSPRPGDMIARNPNDHNDRWLVSAKYFADNFAPECSETHYPTRKNG